MKASFVGLYKRGRYFRPASPLGNGDDALVQRTRREQERFTAAAIAFCFEHDDGFKRHFWQSICRGPEDPEAVEGLRIEVEPHAWADLLVRSRRNGQKFAHVIECKVAAGLAAHQNPKKQEFLKDDGYGFKIREAFAGSDTRLRYVVLGYRENLRLPAAHQELAIQLAERSWADLEADYPGTKLVEDLFDSLGEMGVGKFRMRKTKSIKVTEGLHKAGEAWDAIRTVVDSLGLVENYCQRDGGNYEGNWSMGVHVLTLPDKKGTSQLHRDLQGIGWSGSEFVAWFGYVSAKPKGAKREIWLYCQNHAKAAKIKNRLKPIYTDVVLDSDNDQECVVIKDGESPSENDVEWFESRLRNVAGLPKD